MYVDTLSYLMVTSMKYNFPGHQNKTRNKQWANKAAHLQQLTYTLRSATEGLPCNSEQNRIKAFTALVGQLLPV